MLNRINPRAIDHSELVGPFPGADRLARLGAAAAGFAAGTRLRGHEFHYSSVLEQPDAALAEVSDAAGVAVTETGSRRGRATGSYFHLIGAAT